MKAPSLLGHALELIESVALPGPYPADARVGQYTRRRRYLGSRDRRFVTECVWAWLRQGARARSRWRQAELPEELRDHLAELPTDEELVALEEELARPAELEEDDTGYEARQAEIRPVLRTAYLLNVLELGREGHAPLPLAELAEAARELDPTHDPEGRFTELRDALAGAAWTERAAPEVPDAPPPDAAALADLGSLPLWLAERLLASSGPERARELALAYLEPAPLDLRINLRKRAREKAQEHLARELDREVRTTPHSSLGLRIEGRVNLTSTTASRQGWVEVQDEGSQIIALALDAKPDHVVIDACAGNGGKALALIDIMFRGKKRHPTSREEGRVLACDIAKAKLLEYKRRAEETGLESRVHLLHLYPVGDLPEELPQADIVLVDAPCTGLGTLRRNPELKRRYRPEDVAAFAKQQLAILERFRDRVKPGGLLAFATCSMLREEGEDVAAAFEASSPGFRPFVSRWAAKNLPAAAIEGHRIRLDPVVTGTDAFFLAMWERGELGRLAPRAVSRSTTSRLRPRSGPGYLETRQRVDRLAPRAVRSSPASKTHSTLEPTAPPAERAGLPGARRASV